jgi:hypothetical protein
MRRLNTRKKVNNKQIQMEPKISQPTHDRKKLDCELGRCIISLCADDRNITGREPESHSDHRRPVYPGARDSAERPLICPIMTA